MSFGPDKIRDEFTDLPVSRQRKYQLRQKKKGLCSKCSDLAVSGGLCDKHKAKRRIDYDEDEYEDAAMEAMVQDLDSSDVATEVEDVAPVEQPQAGGAGAEG